MSGLIVAALLLGACGSELVDDPVIFRDPAAVLCGDSSSDADRRRALTELTLNGALPLWLSNHSCVAG